MSNHYLVTGGAGFIGSHLVERLVRDGHRVRVLDNFATGKKENLAPFLEDIDLRVADLRDPEAVGGACEGVDYIFHQGALGSVPRSVAAPITTHDCNTTGTLNILVAARDRGVKRIVYASSSSVYGDTPTLPKHEGMIPSPRSPYALSKLSAEQYCQVFTRVYGLETVSLRYFNVFGPRQDPMSQYAAVIPKFITALLEDRAPTINGDGCQTRDFTYIANNVEANMLAMHAPQASGEAINIACGERYSLLELYQELCRLMGKNIEPVFGPTRSGDVRDSQAAIDQAHKLLGYQPLETFHGGLEKTVQWFVEAHASRSTEGLEV